VTGQTTQSAIDKVETITTNKRPDRRAYLYLIVTIHFALHLASHTQTARIYNGLSPIATHADLPFNCLQHCACAKVEPLATFLRVGAACPFFITTDTISLSHHSIILPS